MLAHMTWQAASPTSLCYAGAAKLQFFGILPPAAGPEQTLDWERNMYVGACARLNPAGQA